MVLYVVESFELWSFTWLRVSSYGPLQFKSMGSAGVPVPWVIHQRVSSGVLEFRAVGPVV